MPPQAMHSSLTPFPPPVAALIDASLQYLQMTFRSVAIQRWVVQEEKTPRTNALPIATTHVLDQVWANVEQT